MLGTFEDAEVTVAVGRFGLYVRHRGNFVSIPKGTVPTELNLELAIELIVAKRAEAAKNRTRRFTEDRIFRFSTADTAYTSPTAKELQDSEDRHRPAALTFEQAMKIVSEADAAPENLAAALPPTYKKIKTARTDIIHDRQNGKNPYPSSPLPRLAPARPDIILTFNVTSQTKLLDFLFSAMPDRKRTTVKDYLKHRQVMVGRMSRHSSIQSCFRATRSA